MKRVQTGGADGFRAIVDDDYAEDEVDDGESVPDEEDE